jgi:hypothetical protein
MKYGLKPNMRRYKALLEEYKPLIRAIEKMTKSLQQLDQFF